MIKAICDLCGAESDKGITKRALDGFQEVDICDDCDAKIDILLDKLNQAHEAKVKQGLAAMGFKIYVDPGAAEHEHNWSQGWVAIEREQRILHQLCEIEGCNATQETEK
jgi:hypothetical protein